MKVISKKNIKVENLSRLFKKTELNQKEAAEKFLSNKNSQYYGGHPINRRTLQRMLYGEVVKIDNYHSLAIFLDKYLRAKGEGENITLDSIFSIHRNTMKKNSSQKSFSLKKDDFLKEGCKLHDVTESIFGAEILRNTINQSNYQKLFLPEISENMTTSLIETVMDRIISIKYEDKHTSENEEFNDKKIKEFIRKETTLPKMFAKLRKEKIKLFVGNYILNKLSIDIIDGSGEIEPDLGFAISGDWQPIVTQANYLIICIKPSSEASVIDFEYQNQWYKEKLEWIVERQRNTSEIILSLKDKEIPDAHDVYEKIMRNDPYNYFAKIERDSAIIKDNNFSFVDQIYEEYEDELTEKVLENTDIKELYEEQMLSDYYESYDPRED